MASRKVVSLWRLGYKGLAYRPPAAVTCLRTRQYASKATNQLLKCVDREISLEQKVLENLPKISSFDVTVKGSMATLLRSFDNEEVKIQLDANSAIEVDNDEIESSEEDDNFDEEEEKEPISLPTFTVTVKNPSGNSLQFDCSFDEYASYDDGDKNMEWDCMRIDSVSTVPTDKTQVETVYSATSTSLNEELYSSLLEFLKERGIDEKFAKEILQFYRVFEHRCFVEDFLVGIQRFCSDK